MMSRPAFPISLYLTDRRVVVVGDDNGAAERARRLEEAGAEVIRLPAGAGDQAVDEALVGASALFAHTGDRERDRQLASAARDRNALAYAHDQPDESDFAMPARVRRGPLDIAISTSGTAPALARRLREILEIALDSEALDALVDELVALRESLPRDQRHRLYELARRLELDGHLVLRE